MPDKKQNKYHRSDDRRDGSRYDTVYRVGQKDFRYEQYACIDNDMEQYARNDTVISAGQCAKDDTYGKCIDTLDDIAMVYAEQACL